MTTRDLRTPARLRGWLRRTERTERPFSYAPHRYMTDGVHLYRFVGWVDRSVKVVFAELEDCRSLEVLLVSAEDLARSALRPVVLS